MRLISFSHPSIVVPGTLCDTAMLKWEKQEIHYKPILSTAVRFCGTGQPRDKDVLRCLQARHVFELYTKV